MRLWSGRYRRDCYRRGLRAGVSSYCPRFASISDPDKRAFWAYTFQALARAEAGLEPTTDVQHTEPEVAMVDTVTKRMIHRKGCCN